MTDISGNPLIGAAAPSAPTSWFPGRVKPYNNITPFTYRDGETYLDVQEALRRWLMDQLVPFIDDTFEAYVLAFNNEIAKLGVYAQQFQDYVESQKVIFDGKIEAYTELVNKSTEDFIKLSTEAMDAVKADADRADAAAARAEMFAATVVAFQDEAMRQLVADPTSKLYGQLKATVTKTFVGLPLVDNTSDAQKPVSTAQAAADKAIADKAAADLAAADTVGNMVRAALNGRQMISGGHSYIVGAGIESPNKWAELFASKFGLIYPTLNTEKDLMRAVSGSRVEEAAQRLVAEKVGSLYWRLGSSAIPLFQALINTARVNGNDAATKRGALHSLRTLALVPNAMAKISATSSRFTYSAGWNDSDGGGVSMSPTAKTVPSGGSTGATVQFTMFQPVVYVMTLSRKEGVAGNTIRVANLTGGGTVTTFDNTATSAADTPHDYVNIPIRVEANIGDVIQVNKASGDGAMTFDGVIVPNPNARPVLFMKEPYLKDYSMSTSYPNGSDAAIKAFNDLIDQVQAEFPTVVYADPNNSGGKWDKNTMLQSDGVHPNAAGSRALAEIMADAVNAKLPASVIATVLRG